MSDAKHLQDAELEDNKEVKYVMLDINGEYSYIVPVAIIDEVILGELDPVLTGDPSIRRQELVVTALDAQSEDELPENISRQLHTKLEPDAETSSLEWRVNDLEKEINMLKCNSGHPKDEVLGFSAGHNTQEGE